MKKEALLLENLTGTTQTRELLKLIEVVQA